VSILSLWVYSSTVLSRISHRGGTADNTWLKELAKLCTKPVHSN
jgi:hypothetical protein